MVKKIILTFFIFFSLFCSSQKNKQWQGYFSYNQVNDITQSTDAVYGASENALFYKKNNEIGSINSIDGLKADVISAVYYSKNKNVTLLGNKNGLLLILFPDGKVVQKRGILDEIPVLSSIKQINHFYEYENKVYLSCDFGISVFDLNTYEFGDSFIIGNNGVTDKVFQTTVLNNEIYAVTQNFGIKKALVSNTNLVDYNQWQIFHPGAWNGIVTFQNQLIISNYNLLYKYDGTSFLVILNLGQVIYDLRVSDNYLTATTPTSFYVYNQSLTQTALLQSNQIVNFNDTFTCGTILNENIYIGTNKNGIISSLISSPTTVEFILPDGPIKNNLFRIKKSSKELWALYGSYSKSYNPYNPSLGEYPISKFSPENGWSLISYTNIFNAKSLSNIAFNPNNENEVYVSSFYSGLLKIVNDIPTLLYNQLNTGTNGLEALVDSSCPLCPPDVRINGPAYDKEGNLWMVNTFVKKALKVLKVNGQWQSYDMSTIFSNTLTESYGIPVVDKNNTKWIPSNHNGLIAFNETKNNKSIVISTETEGNLPSKDVRCVAIDTKNQLWIGTAKGLRIISSVDQFLSETEIQTKNIVILENDLAQELFYDQFILDITIDGANRKWVSIVDSGAYLVSSNGQETIYHFTKENSPLPSNYINDIEIDGKTGEVFFATDKGLVSFKGSATSANDDLNNVYAYPNPVRPEYTGTVKISGLTDKATVKITDIEGNLVYEDTSEGGTIEWDTTAFGKYKVASGVYMILVSAEDGIETKVKKVMIIR